MKNIILQYIKENYGFDDSMSEEIFYEFQNTIQENIEKLEDAIADKDAEESRRFAHTIKGCAANVGHENMRLTALSIEHFAAEERFEEISSAINTLKKLQSELFN